MKQRGRIGTILILGITLSGTALWGAAERPERPDRPERPARRERPERPGQPSRPERPERPARPERPGQPPRPERPGPQQAPNPVHRLEGARKAVLEMATEEQKPKIEAVFAEALKKAQALKEELDQNPENRREFGRKMMQINTELREQLAQILTDEQKAKLEQAFPGRPGDGPGPGAGPGPGGPIAIMGQRLEENLAKLDLNQQQKEQIRKLQEDLRQQLEKVRQETPGDRQAMQAKARELMSQMRPKLREILTPEQAQKLRELMQPQPQ